MAILLHFLYRRRVTPQCISIFLAPSEKAPIPWIKHNLQYFEFLVKMAASPHSCQINETNVHRLPSALMFLTWLSCETRNIKMMITVSSVYESNRIVEEWCRYFTQIKRRKRKPLDVLFVFLSFTHCPRSGLNWKGFKFHCQSRFVEN